MPSKSMTRAQALEFLDGFGPWPTSVLASAEPANAGLCANSVSLEARDRDFARAVASHLSNVFGYPLSGLCVATVPTAVPLSGMPTLRDDFVTETEVVADPDGL